MTLNITLLTPTVIYQSCDYRLSDPATGKAEHMPSTKAVSISVNRSKVETIWEVKWRLCQLWLKTAGSGSPRFFMNHIDKIRWEVK